MSNDQPLILLMKIENEEQLFAFLKNQNEEYKSAKVIFDETFLQNKKFCLSVIGETFTGEVLQGHITADLLDIMQNVQSLLLRTYAIAKYNSTDIRKIPEIEKQKLIITFKISDGSTIIEAVYNFLTEKLQTFNSLDMSTKLILASVVCLLGGGFYYTQYKTEEIKIQREVEETKREEIRSRERLEIIKVLQPQVYSAIKDFSNETIKSLDNANLKIDSVSINNKQFSKNDITALKKSGLEDGQDFRYQQDDGIEFDIVSIERDENRIFADIINKEYGKINVELAENFFHKHQDVLINAFKDKRKINVNIGYHMNGNGIKKYWAVTSINTPTTDQ